MSDLAIKIVNKDEVKTLKRKIQILKTAVLDERKSKEILSSTIQELKDKANKLQKQLKNKQKKNQALLSEIRELKDQLIEERNQRSKESQRKIQSRAMEMICIQLNIQQLQTMSQQEQTEQKTQEIESTQPKKQSKNEQKRLAKQKKLQEEREQKRATKPQRSQKKQQLDPTQYFFNRSNTVKELKKDALTTPYPHKFHCQYNVRQFVQRYRPITIKGQFLQEEVSTAGRIMSINALSKKLIFYSIKGEGCSLQVMCNFNAHKGERDFFQLHSTLRRGDIVGVIGHPGRTATDQLSIAPGTILLLSPCLHMLPKALKNEETRYRKRYLDLIINDRTRDTFIVRSKVLSFIRRYLSVLGFIEVQTPMMNMIPGGATAKPFITHHNDLDMKLYMRIAPQLFLKQCIVGGMERVFEIGKNFRNESIDQTHNPQYTACQFYMAYADYNDLLTITQDMLSKMVMEVTGSFIVQYHPDPDTPQYILNIDFTPPWRRIPMMEQLQKQLNTPLPHDITSQQARVFYDAQCIKHDVVCSPPRTTIRLIDKLVGKFLQSQCLNPTFITQHPQIMSPLAKYHRSKPGLTQRFELFINHHQYCNAYTELNDPFIQKELFMDQVKEKDKGDDESMFYDEVFVEALEHALPPTGGWGLGIDRTVMILTDHIRIQEVLLFPAMKPIEEKKE